MYPAREDPGDGVTDVERQDVIGIQGADGKDPDDAEYAGAQEGNDHGLHSLTHAAQDTAPHVHKAAEEIGGGDDGQSVHARLYDEVAVLPRGVDQQKLVTEQHQRRAQSKANDEHHGGALEGDLLDALVLPCPHVLTDEGQGGVVDRVHGGVDKALQVPRRGVARNGDRGVGVDRRLDDDVGEGEHTALQSRRQTDGDHTEELFAVYPEARQPQGGLGLAHVDQRCSRRHVLGGRRSHAHADGAQTEAQHPDQVEDDVDHTRRREVLLDKGNAKHDPYIIGSLNHSTPLVNEL